MPIKESEVMPGKSVASAIGDEIVVVAAGAAKVAQLLANPSPIKPH
jgi:hypothetical protein